MTSEKVSPEAEKSASRGCRICPPSFVSLEGTIPFFGMIPYVNLNGSRTSAAEASLDLSDVALLRGYAIFDYFLFQRKRPFFLKDYIDRFYRSAHFMHLEPPFSKAQLRDYILELIQANDMDEGAIRLLLTGGNSPDGFKPGRPNLIILQHPYPNHPAERYTKGVKVLLDDYLRDLPEVKSINYTRSIFLQPRLQDAGALEPLYHQEGLVTEAARSNIFAVFGKKLVTPYRQILMGVTRRKLIELARNDYEIEERDLQVDELIRADELLLTGSSKGLMPVVQVDDHTIGEGKPGPVTRHLMEAFEAYRLEHLADPMVRN